MTMAARSGERLERGRAGGVDREHAVQAGDRENALHGAAGDDQPVDARVEELQHAFLELRSGVDVDFAGEGDDTESVALSGEVDIYTAPQFKECMLELLDAGVDRLVVTSRAVERVLSITGLDRVFTIHATRAAALE